MLKILFSLIVILLWFFLMFANVAAMGKTRDEALRLGMSLAQAQMAGTVNFLISSIVISIISALALWFVWS